MNKVQKALVKAYEVHKSYRKGTSVPYFVHILDVAKYLMYETNDEDVICAGILHDTLEDSTYSKEELIDDFGLDVFNLVNFSTEPGNTIDKTTAEQKKTWRSRKEHSIGKIKDASYEELLVFTADKLSNILSMQEDLIWIKSENKSEDELWNRFNATKEDIEWHYKSILAEVEPKLEGTRLLSVFRESVVEVFD